MIILTNILKKASDFVIIGVAACLVLLNSVNALADDTCTKTAPIPGACDGTTKECCTKEGYVPNDIRQSINSYKERDRQGCFDAIPLGSTTTTYISSLPGERCVKNGSKNHKGMDIAAVKGTPVVAAADGKIEYVDPGCYGKTGAGIYIKMRHNINPNSIYASEAKSCKCYFTKYMHLSKIADGVKVGASYKKGAEIGKVGGSSCLGGNLNQQGYGYHLHFQIDVGDSIVNPLCPNNQDLCKDTKSEESSAASTYNNSKEVPAKKEKASNPPVPSSKNIYTSTSGTNEQVKSDYKCNLSENFNSIKNCMFCKLFQVIFNTASSVARASHNTFSASLIPLLAVGLAIWIAQLILKYVSDMTVKDPKLMLNEIFAKSFIVGFIIVLLKLDVVEFFDMFVSPIFDTGLKFSQLVMGNMSCGTWEIDGSGLPSSMGNSILCAIDAIQNRLEKLLALGSNSICIALYIKSFWSLPIFPHFGYLITGVFLWLIAVVFMLAYPFLLIDSILQFAIATSLFPVALASTAFEITKKYLNIWKVVNIFMNAMFTFIFLTVVLFILLNGIDNAVMGIIENAYKASSGGDYFSLEALGWHTKTFMKLVFFLFLGKAVLDEIPSFAESFASAISLGQSGGSSNMGIGRKVGGMATGLATNIGKTAISTTGGALKTGGAIAGNFVINAAKTARYDYLVKNTQRRLNEQRMAGNDSDSVTGRDWLGRKVTRRIVRNPDGTISLESSRKGMFNKNNTISTHQNNLMSIQTKTFKDGSKQDKYEIKSAYAKSLINSDGTRNDVAVNALLQSSGLSKEEINKVILNQMLKQRMPKAEGANLEGKYKAETVNSYVDDKGREVFEVRRTMEDGSTNVFRMTKGSTRDMIEFEQIDKKGNAQKLASDGVIQMHEKYKYEVNANGLGDIKEGQRKVKFSNAAAFKGASLYDADGNINDSFADTEIMFGEVDLETYKYQMKKYGDVLQQYRFGR